MEYLIDYTMYIISLIYSIHNIFLMTLYTYLYAPLIWGNWYIACVNKSEYDPTTCIYCMC